MSKYTFLENSLTKEDIEYFTKCNKGMEIVPTGDCLKEEYETGSITRVIFKGRHTPYGCCRDCGDHWVIAKYSYYERVDKETFAVTVDVEDK